jgi:hypothetical protein
MRKPISIDWMPRRPLRSGFAGLTDLGFGDAVTRPETGASDLSGGGFPRGFFTENPFESDRYSKLRLAALLGSARWIFKLVVFDNIISI